MGILASKRAITKTNIMLTVFIILVAIVGIVYYALEEGQKSNSPSRSPSLSPSLTASPVPTQLLSPSFSPTPTTSATASPEASLSSTPAPTPAPTSTLEPTPTTKTPTEFDLNLESSTVSVGGIVAFKGTLYSYRQSRTEEKGGSATVELTWENGPVTLYWSVNDSGFVFKRTETLISGEVNINFVCNEVGIFRFKLIWEGSLDFNGSESNIALATVS
jgi:hypothetical protein